MAAESLTCLALKPGVYDSIEIEQYHGMPGISKTGLDLIERSPAHYFAGHLDPARPPRRARAGQLEGNLAHCAILEPDAFDHRYSVPPPDAPRRPTDAQWRAQKPSAASARAIAWWLDFNAANESKLIITAEQRETAMRQAESVLALPEVAEALAIGKPEVTAIWLDESTGELCRCRPDFVNECSAGVVLLDVKTYSSAQPAEFARQAARKAYDKQAAFYSDGYAFASGRPVLGFVFVVVESEWPYAASACMLDEPSMQAGRLAYRRNLDTYARCRKSNTWPGYTSAIELISLPKWALLRDLAANEDTYP